MSDFHPEVQNAEIGVYHCCEQYKRLYGQFAPERDSARALYDRYFGSSRAPLPSTHQVHRACLQRQMLYMSHHRDPTSRLARRTGIHNETYPPKDYRHTFTDAQVAALIRHVHAHPLSTLDPVPRDLWLLHHILRSRRFIRDVTNLHANLHPAPDVQNILRT